MHAPPGPVRVPSAAATRKATVWIGSGGDGLFGAAVLALGRSGRQVAGQARGAGLDRWRIAEHHLPAPRLDVLVRHDDDEVDDGQEDDEVDHHGNERADSHAGLRVAGLAELDAEADRLSTLEP